jgi:hypothetical protein
MTHNDNALRSKLIRLAASRPDLREHLLPLVREAALDTSAPGVTPQVGDILFSSWGYDQTNVDFYEVRKVTGSMVVLQKLQNKVVRDSGPTVYVVPALGQYKGELLRRKFGPSWRGDSYSVSIKSYAGASKWDGNPVGQTAAGWGH